MVDEFSPQQELKKDNELYPKKPFEIMMRDVATGAYKNKNDVYSSYSSPDYGVGVISEHAEKGGRGAILREIVMSWNEENKKFKENEVMMVIEKLFDKNRMGNNKDIGFIIKNKKGDKIWEQRQEYDKSGKKIVRTVDKDKNGNFLVIKERIDRGSSVDNQTVYYDHKGEIGLIITSTNMATPLESRDTVIYKDEKGNILERQEWKKLSNKAPILVSRDDGSGIQLSPKKYLSDAPRYDSYLVPPNSHYYYYCHGGGEEMEHNYKKRLYEIKKQGIEA